MTATAWREDYQKLSEFVANHPDIQIVPGTIIIPENIRPEFYRLFDATAMKFAAGVNPGLFADAVMLSVDYLDLAGAVSRRLGLQDVILEQPLNWFMQDPADGLARGLIDLLFATLNGTLDLADFEARSAPSVDRQLKNLYRLGYEKWLEVCLVWLAAPEKLMQVPLRDPGRSEHAHILGQFEPLKEDLPNPIESGVLSFNHTLDILLNNPDYIMLSAGKYLGVRSHLGKPITIGNNISQVRQWLPLKSVTLLEPSSIFLYVADNVYDVTLVGDVEKICQPDLVIECIDQPDWYLGDRPEGIQRQHDSLKPRFGTLLVARQPVPAGSLKLDLESLAPPPAAVVPDGVPVGEPRPAGISLITAGLDRQALASVMGMLLPRPPKLARRSFWQRLLAWLKGKSK